MSDFKCLAKPRGTQREYSSKPLKHVFVKLTISSCLSMRMSRYWACGKFGEHERGVRVVRGAAECNSSLLSALQTSKCSISRHTHSCSKIVFAAPRCVVYLLFEKYTSIPVNDSFHIFQLNLVSGELMHENGFLFWPNAKFSYVKENKAAIWLAYLQRCGYMAGNRSRFSKH